MIAVAGFRPISRHFDDIVLVLRRRQRVEARDFHADGSERILIDMIGENRLNLFWQRIGSDVPVFGCSADQDITDTSTDDVCFETGLFQALHCFDNGQGKGKLHRCVNDTGNTNGSRKRIRRSVLSLSGFAGSLFSEAASLLFFLVADQCIAHLDFYGAVEDDTALIALSHFIGIFLVALEIAHGAFPDDFVVALDFE